MKMRAHTCGRQPIFPAHVRNNNVVTQSGMSKTWAKQRRIYNRRTMS